MQHARPLSPYLESTFGSPKGLERFGGSYKRNSQLGSYDDRRKRVQHVVPPGHAQFHRPQRPLDRFSVGADHLEPLGCARRFDILRPIGIGTRWFDPIGKAANRCLPAGGLDDLSSAIVVRAPNDGSVRQHSGHELREALLNALLRAVVVQVVRLDVGDHRQIRPQGKKRIVSLASFGEEGAVPNVNVTADPLILAAHEDRRI